MNALRSSVLLLLIGGLWLALAGMANEPPRVAIAVEGARYQYEPATVRLRVRVERHPENRALTVALISDGFERSSLEQLDGASAPLTRWIEYRDVPQGVYYAFAVVQRTDKGLLRAVEQVTVMGRF